MYMNAAPHVPNIRTMCSEVSHQWGSRLLIIRGLRHLIYNIRYSYIIRKKFSLEYRLSNYTDILIIDWCNCLCIRVVG